MSVPENHGSAVVFHSLVHEPVELVVDVFHVAVREQDIAAFHRDHPEVGTAVTAVAVAFHAYYRNAELSLQLFRIRDEVACVQDHIYIRQLRPYIAYFIEFSVRIAYC